MLPIDLCTGCFACQAICPLNCINSTVSREGFSYPQIDESKCVQCRKCEAVCPVLHDRIPDQNARDIPLAIGAFSKNETTRKASSSGGLFSELAQFFLERGGIVYGAAFDTFQTVRHMRCATLEDLSRIRGSKYVQSSTEGSFQLVKQDLQAGKKVLFSGTACQVDGLLNYLGSKNDQLTTIDLVCHGVGSPKALEEYLRELVDRKQSPVNFISFRDKDNGWKNYNVKVFFENGEIESGPFGSNVFMKSYLSNLCLRQSCYFCQFKSVNRRSDITLADYWGLDRINHELDDDGGCSFVLIHSESGKQLFHEIASTVVTFPASSDDLVRYNASCVKSSNLHNFRWFFFSRLGKIRFSKLVSLCLQPTFFMRFKRKVKMKFNMFR